MAVRSITTRLSLDGEQEFKRGMTAVNAQLKALVAELKAVTAE